MSTTQQKLDLARKLDALAEANEDSHEDYYGAQFWSEQDVAMLREAAAALREPVRGSDNA